MGTICKLPTINNSAPVAHDQALEFLQLAIQDPNSPSHCGACIDGAFVTCTKSERYLKEKKVSKVAAKSRPIDPKVWDPVVAFLFLERTDEQLHNLIDTLSQCDCQMKLPHIKQYHEDMQNGEIGGMLGTIRWYNDPRWIEGYPIPKERKTGWNTCLIDMFDILCTVIEHSTIKAAAKGSAHTWPINLTDMIPFGPDNFVKSIFQWYAHVGDPVVFRLMARVLHVCQSLVIPSLLETNFIEHMVHTTRELVEHTIVHTYAGSRGSPENACLFECMGRFFFHVNDVFTYIKTCCSMINDDYKLALLQGSETKIVQLCSIIIYISEALPGFQWENKPMFILDPSGPSTHGQDIFRFFKMHKPPRRPLPVHPLIQELDVKKLPMQNFPSAVRPKALNMMREFRIDTRCSAQGCPNTLQEVGKSFQRCGRCAIVSYCGRECQTRAWKEEIYPHKRICPVLRTCVEKAGGSLFFAGVREGHSEKVYSSLNTVFENWYAGPGLGIDEHDLSLIVEWGTSIQDSRLYAAVTGGTEVDPGYEDYEQWISDLSKRGKVLKREFFGDSETDYVDHGFSYSRVSKLAACSNLGTRIRMNLVEVGYEGWGYPVQECID